MQGDNIINKYLNVHRNINDRNLLICNFIIKIMVSINNKIND